MRRDNCSGESSALGAARCGNAGTPGFVPPAFASSCPRGSWLGGAPWVQVCPGSLRTEGGANIGKSLPGCRFGELWSHVQGSVAIVTGYFRSLRWWFIIAAREAAARRERQGGRRSVALGSLEKLGCGGFFFVLFAIPQSPHCFSPLETTQTLGFML